MHESLDSKYRYRRTADGTAQKEMNIMKSQMAGNVYSRTDSDTWMTVPTFAQTRKSSFLDVSSLEKYNTNFLEGMDAEKDELPAFKDLYTKRH